jgi:tetratricopeptide (TPR) repeat protein
MRMPWSQRIAANKGSSRRYAVDHRLLLLTIGVVAVTVPSAYVWYKHQMRQTASALLARAEQLHREEQWADSTAYYQRYLQIEPEDTQALLQMVKVVASGPNTPDRLGRLNNLLYRTIGRAPERSDLRRMLAENLLQSGAFEEAQKEAEWLLKYAPGEAVAARKIKALSLFQRARLNGGVAVSEAVSALFAAAQESPGDAQLIEVTADALRQYPDAISLPETSSANAADQLIDTLVATDSQNVSARLIRYRYRARHKLPDDAGDLEAALEIEPDNVDAILLSAVSAVADPSDEKSRSHAESLVRRAIDVAPYDARSYLVLAGMLEQSNERDKALGVLESGRRATDGNFDVCLECARLQISTNKLDASRETLRELETRRPTYLVELDGDARIRVENRLGLLRAQLDLAQGNLRAAVARLHAIRLILEAKQGHDEIPEWLDACRLLADTHARIGEWDKASEYWGKLAATLPGDLFVVRQAVNAHLNDGNAKAAVDTIDEFIRHAEPTSDLLVQLVQAHVMLQSNRPRADQSWSEFERALESAKSAAADRAELVFAEVNYLVAKTNDRKAAADLLRASENRFADKVDFWRTAAHLYQELGQRESMHRAVGKHRELASAGDHGILEVTLLVKEGQHKQADELLAKLGQSLTTVQRKGILRLQVKALAAKNDVVSAFDRAKRLIDADPKDTATLTMGIDLALSNGDVRTAEKWESMLSRLTEDGFDARYFRARRMLESYEKLQGQEKPELGRSVSGLRAERPKWYPATTLAAQYAKLQGDWRQALADYRLAVELGDRRPSTLQQIVALLYKYGRFDEAQKYLSYLPINYSSDQFFDNMAIELAVRLNQSAAALEAARQSVKRYPDDPMRRITLANLLLRYGEPHEGLTVLREAARKFPNDSSVWLGLFTALVETGKVDEARKILSTLVKGSVLPQEHRYFIAAQGHDLLGDFEGAKKLYELALKQNPKEIEIRLKYAKLLSSVDPRAARAQYERALQQEATNGEARRQLAVLLAATGQETDWTQSTQLLSSARGAPVTDTRTNDRLRAMLLTRKGRTRAERISNCQAARDILQRLIQTDSAEQSDLNRLLIAQVLEQEAKLSNDRSLLLAARDQLRSVANRAPTAEILSLYIEFLLRHGSTETGSVAGDSASEEPNSGNVGPNENFLTEAEAWLDDFRQSRPEGSGVEVVSVAYQARLLQARGHEAEAKAHITEFVAQQSQESQDKNTQAQRYLAIGRLYSSIGAHAEAENWYRRLMELLPNGYVPVVQSLLAQEKRQEAIELCLRISDGKPTAEMAALIANVMTATKEPLDESPEAQATLESAVADHSENIDLLHAEAVRLASRGQYEDAIVIFRRILALDPRNVVALNNLATVLAERPNLRGEALEHIQRAIEMAGRQAALLDTQGTIYLKIGDAGQAIASLEEATAGGSADARYYLHLAAAYHQAKRYEDASRMLIEARGFGLENFVLTDDDRQLLATLDEELNPLGPSAGASL